MPNLSIIIPYFNGVRFLRNAVMSIQRECVPECEIIVVDDASTDEGCQTLNRMGVSILRRTKNGGVASALNTGIAAAKGKYVAFLDQDDLIVRGSLRTRLNWLMENKSDRAVTGSMATVIDEYGERLGEYQSVMHPNYQVPGNYIDRKFIDSGRMVPVSPPLYMYQMDLLQEVGNFDESFKVCTDSDYFFRILQKERIRFLNIPIIHHRLHKSNLSSRIENGRVVDSRRYKAEVLWISMRYGLPIS